MAKRSRYEEIHDRYQTASSQKLGTKYERLAALVLKSLETKGVVIHDRKLTGASGEESQIDVIIEDKNSSNQRRILVECKDFDVKGDDVGIGIVRGFWAVVEDIEPTDAMIVTCNNFTAPAMRYAAYKRIKLAILRQIEEEDLKDRITRVNIDFEYETTPTASTNMLFPNEEIIGEFQRCLRENDINEISLPDSEVYFEGPNGEISVNEFVNMNVNEYRRNNPAHENGTISVNLSGCSIKVKDISRFPISAAIITFKRNIYSEKLEMYAERVAEMIFKILEDGEEDLIIFGDDLERFQIDPATHEVKPISMPRTTSQDRSLR